MEFIPHRVHTAPDNLSGDPNDPKYIERIWLSSLTNDMRLVERLANPTSGRDYLLRFRAEPLLDHARLYRAVNARAKRRGSRELLHDEHQEDFEHYLNLLSPVRRMISEDIPAGYVLTRNYDAICLQTESGKIILVSEVLRYFLYFMNIANCQLIEIGDIPPDVRGHAAIIAIRTMAMIEALDFELDPRGQVPLELEQKLNEIVTWQMRFVIGHEYAHHALAHKGIGVQKIPESTATSLRTEWNNIHRSWEEEFEADLHAIVDVDDPLSRAKLVQGAVLFFLHVHCHERVAKLINPEFVLIETHPPTPERLNRIGRRFGHLTAIDDNWINSALAGIEDLADHLIKILEERPNLLTTYGSIYLGQWKGPELVDRVDY